MDAELDALIAELKPPTLAEILARFEPLPTLEDLLGPPTVDASADSQPLSPEVSRQVGLMIDEARSARTLGDHERAAARMQAVSELRCAARGREHWQTEEAIACAQSYAVVAALPEEGRHAIAAAAQSEAQSDASGERGEYRLQAEQLTGVLRVYLRTLGRDDIEVMRLANDLGNCLSSLGEYHRAEALFVSSTDLRSRRFGAGNPYLCISLNGLAAVERDQGELLLAQKCGTLALAFSRRGYGQMSSRTAAALNNLGNVLSTKGDWTSAERLLRQSLAIVQQLWGSSHPNVAYVLDNLAETLTAAGDPWTAEPLRRESVTLTRALAGAAHPDTGLGLMNLSTTLLDEGDIAGATECSQQAVAILRGSLGRAHPTTLVALHDLAVARREAGALAEAAEMLRAILPLERQTLGEDHPAVAKTLHELSLALLSDGDAQGACVCARQALACYRTRHADDDAVTATMLNTLAQTLVALGGSDELAEADALLEEGLRIRQQADHAQMYDSYVRRANFLLRRHPRDAVRFYAEAIEQIEGLRQAVSGDELQAAQFARVLQRLGPFSGMIRALLAPVPAEPCESTVAAEAYDYLEQGRGRALLDLLERGARLGAGLNSSAAAAEEQRFAAAWERIFDARAAQVRVQTQIKASGAQGPDPCADLQRRLGLATDDELDARRKLRKLIRTTWRDRGLQPLRTSEIAAALQPAELLMAFDVGPDDTVALLVRADGAEATTLQWSNGGPLTKKSIGRALEALRLTASEGGRPSTERTDQPPDANELSGALLPAVWRDRLSAARRVFIIPDGPLHQVPFEMLTLQRGRAWIDAGPPVVYGPSATIILTKRKWAKEHRDADSDRRGPALVAVGNPVFSRPVAVRPAPPDHGVLLAQVMPDGIAAASGLRAGDVLLTYDAEDLSSPEKLGDAIQQAAARQQVDQAAPVPVSVWRDGQTLALTVEPGKLGVQPSQTPMPLALQDYSELRLTEDQRTVKYASAATRDGFGELKPLPGTRAEIDALARVMKRAAIDENAVKILAGEDATLTRLAALANHPRFLHFATHATAESGARVYESALALTVPAAPTPADFGFLRLQDLLEHWGGKLEGTELVVLSGCQTARGRLEAADGFVGLTWGFLFAGADSVIASLWKVDDAATALLMSRLYENLLGTYEQPGGTFAAHTPMPKADALHEAKRWLRSRTPAENRAALADLGLDVEQLARQYRAERGQFPSDDPELLADPFDFSAPRFWAAFVLIGDPD